jgi:predicted ATPase
MIDAFAIGNYRSLRDLAAAIGTILEIGDVDALLESLRMAFPGATIDVENIAGRFHLLFTERGLLRPLGLAELSDGTLRFLLWLAALHTPRPPELMVLNEPETSLHGDLLLPLAAMIRHAARSSQLIVVSHAPALIAALQEVDGCNTIALRKDTGETMVHTDAEPASWTWPAR